MIRKSMFLNDMGSSDKNQLETNMIAGTIIMQPEKKKHYIHYIIIAIYVRLVVVSLQMDSSYMPKHVTKSSFPSLCFSSCSV